MRDDAIAREAQRRHESHINHPTHRPLSPDNHLVGLRGEEAWSREFGGQVDLTPRPSGDGGRDFIVRLSVEFKVDIKCFRNPVNLIVEVGRVKKGTIYVLAGYDDTTDKACLLGWAWGLEMLMAPHRDFGRGVVNHYISRDKLRSMRELRKRISDGSWNDAQALAPGGAGFL
jgi:hypothetical protein